MCNQERLLVIRQGWKTPRGPPVSILVLWAYQWCTVGVLFRLNRSMECELSCPVLSQVFLVFFLYCIVFYYGCLIVLV